MPKALLHTIAFILVCASAQQRLHAQQGYDYRQNSVYIFNFIRYTEWAVKKSNITIGVVGNTQAEEELRTLVGRKRTNQVNINVRRVTGDEARKCDVILVAASANNQLKDICKATEKQPILIITEKENMGRLGACISFTINEENDFKTEYQLSLKNCRLRGLRMSDEIKNNAELMR